MVYIKRHPKPYEALTTLPKTVAGFARRYRAETEELGRLKGTKPRAVLKVVRSLTLIRAEALGEVRFRQLLRELRISMRSPTLRWHRILARNAGKLLRIADWLPDDDGALVQLARMDSDELHNRISSRQIHPFLTGSELKEILQLMEPAQ